LTLGTLGFRIAEMSVEQESKPELQKWEYNSMIVVNKSGDLSTLYGGTEYPLGKQLDLLNKVGEEGWELVSSVPIINTDMEGSVSFTSTKGFFLYFKRPKI